MVISLSIYSKGKTVFSMIWKGFGETEKEWIWKNSNKKNAVYVQVSFKSINGVFYYVPGGIRFYIILSECFGVVPNFFLKALEKVE